MYFGNHINASKKSYFQQFVMVSHVLPWSGQGPPTEAPTTGEETTPPPTQSPGSVPPIPPSGPTQQPGGSPPPGKWVQTMKIEIWAKKKKARGTYFNNQLFTANML